MSMLLFLLLVGVGIEGGLGSTLQMGNPGSLRTASNVKEGLWWIYATFYQIDPKYFRDSDGDCVGDLKGIAEKVWHLKEMNVDAVVLSPIHRKDNLTAIRPEFGTLDNFNDLIGSLTGSNIKVILEFDLSSTSTEHPWFTSHPSYYFRADTPNNWLSADPDYNFGFSAWVQNRTNDYYLSFFENRAQLNLTNPQVKREIDDVLTFWMSQGVAGFKLSRCSYLAPSNHLVNESLSFCSQDIYKCFNHSATINTKEALDIFKSWYELVNKREGILIAEPFVQSAKDAQKYVDNDAALILRSCFTKSAGSEDRINYPSLKEWGHDLRVLSWAVTCNRKTSTASLMEMSFCKMISALMFGAYFPMYGDEIGMDSTGKGFKWDNTRNSGFSDGIDCPGDIVSVATTDLATQKLDDSSNYAVFKRLRNIGSELARNDVNYFDDISDCDLNSCQFFAFTGWSNVKQCIVLINEDVADRTVDLVEKEFVKRRPFQVEVPIRGKLYNIGDRVDPRNVKVESYSAVVLSHGSPSRPISLTLLLLSLPAFLVLFVNN